MAGNKDIMIITGVKVKYLLLKEDEYGHHHVSNVLDTTPLQDLVELRNSLKMPTWDYNDKFYLKTNGTQIKELPGEIEFKDNPYCRFNILVNMAFKRMVSKLLVIAFLKLINLLTTNI